MGKKEKEKINRLAGLFYQSGGYQAAEGFDFSKSNHPQETNMWNMALIAHCFFNEKFNDLKYQV